MAQLKEQIKVPEKNTTRDEEIANLSDAEFKTLVIRMPTEMVEYGHKKRGKSEGYEKCTGKIYREPTVKGRKPGLKSTIWNKS